MRYTIDWRRLLDAGWWHWAATLPLLAGHLLDSDPERARHAFVAAAALCAAAAAWAYARSGDASAMAVQVRISYLVLLVLGLAPAARWFHWLQLAGTACVVCVGYCPLARVLALAPWNRDGPLTAAMARAALTRRPASGGIFRPAGPAAAAGQSDCSDGCGGACELPAPWLPAAPQ